MLKKVETTKAPAAIGPYSQGMLVNGMLYASGQIPIVPETGEVVKEMEQCGRIPDGIREPWGEERVYDEFFFYKKL